MKKTNWKEKRKGEIEKLFDCVKEKFSVSKEQLLSSSRKKELVIARKAFMNILFEVFELEDGMLQEDIASVVNRDRTSFTYHRKEHLNFYGKYKKYKEEYNTLKEQYKNTLK